MSSTLKNRRRVLDCDVVGAEWVKFSRWPAPFFVPSTSKSATPFSRMRTLQIEGLLTAFLAVEEATRRSEWSFIVKSSAAFLWGTRLQPIAGLAVNPFMHTLDRTVS